MKKTLSLMLCLLMVISIMPMSVFAADTRIEVSEFVATSNFNAPTYGERVKTYYIFNFIKGKEAYITSSMGDWYKWDESSSSWIEFTELNFIEGKYKYSNQIRIDEELESGYGTTHKLAQTATIIINGEEWTYSKNPMISSTYSYTRITSPEYTVKKPDEKVNSVKVTGLEKPVAGGAPDTTASVESEGAKIGMFGKVSWMRKNADGTWGAFEKFEGNSTYRCNMQVLPLYGYIFPASKNDLTVTINGEAAVIGDGYSSKIFYVLKEYTIPCGHSYDNYDDTDCNICGEVRYRIKLHVASVINSKIIYAYPNEVVTIGAPRLGGWLFTGWVVTEGSIVAIEDPYAMETTVIMGNENAEIKPYYDDCPCKCHGNFIQKLIFKITNFFASLFDKTKKTCACGFEH